LANAAVSWCSKVQRRTARASCNSEYVALGQAGAEASWLRNFLGELRVPVKEPTPIASDSQSALTLVNNPAYYEANKHLDIQCHFVREQVVEGEIELYYVPAEAQAADALTKPVTRKVLEHCRDAIGVVALKGVESQDSTDLQASAAA